MALFSKAGITSGKSKSNVDFAGIERRLRDSNPQPINNLTLLSNWIKFKYETIYSKPMIGYNRFHAINTIKKLSEFYSISYWEVIQLIDKWFTSYHTLGYDTKCGNELTLSTLNTQWIVESLKSDKPLTTNRSNSYTRVGSGGGRTTDRIQSSGKKSNKSF
jgi:hypothetical protein